MKAVYLLFVIAALTFVLIDILSGSIDWLTFIVLAICIGSAVTIALIEQRKAGV